MGCISADNLVGFLEGRLPPAAEEEIEEHVEGCEACRELLAESARAAFPDPPPEVVQGGRFGRYQIVRPIGAGGMGVVYAARDPKLHRMVALKMLRPSGGGGAAPPELRERILREARAMARLSHPNVLAVYDVGELGDQVFLAMELVEGGTLTAWLRGEAGLAPGGPESLGGEVARPKAARRGWREVLDVFLAAGRGLAAAHAAGLVHRDFKPDNVLFGSDGRVRVTDFGLARAAAAELPRAAAPAPAGQPEQLALSLQSSALAGSPAYMAPEQLRGETVDARADVFSFCVALHQAVFGELPFAGGTLQELERAIATGPRWPAGAAKVPTRLRRLLARGMQADPKSRFTSMEALLQELSGLRHGLRAYLGRRATVPATLGVASLFAIALVYGATRRPSRNTSAIHSIAVLSLDNLSSDPGQAYFADGMTEELTTSLARIGSLKIISRTSAVQYRGTKKPLTQIARELGVDAIVEGSVSRFGDKVRITAQLIDARTDQHLWADSYQRTLGEVLSIQNSVAMEITRQVQSKLSPTEEKRFKRPTSVNPAAYEAYLRGRYLLSRQDPDALRKGLAEFQHAIDIDPTYAPAYSGLADTFNLFANYGLMTPAEAFPRAKAAALKSIQLDETLAEPHASLGFTKHHFDWDWRGAEAEYQRAIELSPSYASAHARYAEYLSTASRHEQAISEIRKAHELDPLSRYISTNIGRVLYYAHRYDEAIKELLQTLELDPNAGHAHFLLGLAYEQKGMNTEAIEQYTKAQAMLSWPYSLALAHLYAAVGRRTDSEAILRQAERQPDDWYWVAGVQAALGNKDAAFDYLDKVYDARSFFLCFLDVDPYFDPLHSDPRFAILRSRIGLR